MKLGNLIAAIALIVLATVFFVSASQFGIGSSGDVGSGFFPKAISSLMIICSIIIIVQTLKENSKEKLITIYLKKALLLGIVTVAYVFIMNILGFVLMTPVYVLLMLYLINEKGITKNLIIAFGITALIYVSFKVGLNVRLPMTFFGI